MQSVAKPTPADSLASQRCDRCKKQESAASCAERGTALLRTRAATAKSPAGKTGILQLTRELERPRVSIRSMKANKRAVVCANADGSTSDATDDAPGCRTCKTSRTDGTSTPVAHVKPWLSTSSHGPAGLVCLLVVERTARDPGAPLPPTVASRDPTTSTAPRRPWPQR